ncbi:unnamed protein product [Sphagnum troendelagicum]|uniref:Uncharacterized protein n=1 Tax=Sphagnum troendelagicum TaxID=128251 RepID=A0ABP0TUD5_9BRYO
MVKQGSGKETKNTAERGVAKLMPLSDPLTPITTFRSDYDLRKQENEGEIGRQQRQGFSSRIMAWVNRTIFVYNVTTGLYMLDWWERYLFNTLLLLLLWFVCYNSCHFAVRCFEGSLSRFTHLSPQTHAPVLNMKLFDMGWMGMKDTTGVPAAGSFMAQDQTHSS